MKERQTTIRAKLLKVYITLLVVSIGFVSVVGLRAANASMRNVEYESTYSKLDSDLSMTKELIKRDYGELSAKEGDLVGDKGKAFLKDTLFVDLISHKTKDIVTLFVKEEEGFKRIATTLVDSEGKRAIGTVIDTEHEVYKTVSEGKRYLGEVMLLGEKHLSAYEPIYNEKEEIIGMLFVGVNTHQLNQLIEGQVWRTGIIFAILFFLSIIVSIGCTYITAHKMTKPLEDAMKYTATLTQLDLTAQVSRSILESTDEMGILGKGLAALTKILKSIIEDTLRLSNIIKESTKVLNNSSQYVNKISEEINLVVEQISSGAIHQAENTQDGANRIEELGELLSSTEGQIKVLEVAITKMEKLKDEGLVLINYLKQSSIKTKEDAEESYKSIIVAKAKADIIAQASERINAIASQTGLLALNAAIEAARTGEEGKGFAVIAMEIRKLSDQTDQFTKEIGNNITELIDTNREAVESIGSITESVEEQNKQVNETYTKFYGIAESIDYTMNTLEELIEKQNVMIAKRDEIIQIMQTLSSIAQENAASTQEVASAIKEQTQSVENIYVEVKQLATLSEEMDSTVMKFKL